MGLLPGGRRSLPNGQPPLHECVTGDHCHPTWLDTSGPGLTLNVPQPDPNATVLVTERIVFDGVLVAIPGDYITPEQATLWGV